MFLSGTICTFFLIEVPYVLVHTSNTFVGIHVRRTGYSGVVATLFALTVTHDIYRSIIMTQISSDLHILIARFMHGATHLHAHPPRLMTLVSSPLAPRGMKAPK